MASEKQATPHLFIDEVQGHQKRYSKLVQFTHSSTKAAGVMLLAAIVALVVANSAAYEPFIHFWHTEVGFVLGDAEHTMSLAHIINDMFMAIFFLLVGLESEVRDDRRRAHEHSRRRCFPSWRAGRRRG